MAGTGRPTLDLVFVAIALTTFGVVLYSQASPGGFFLSIFGIIFFFLTPVAPILLIIGTTRLATRSTGRVYEVASRVVRPLAPNLHHVISRNLARNPRRASNISVIIALGLGFGLFVLALLGSTIAFQDRNLRAVIGADVQVIGPAEDATFGANVSALPGVETVARVVELLADPIFCCAEAFALESVAFFAATRPEPWQLDPLSQEQALEVLTTDGLVLLSKEYAETAFLRVGDLLRLEGSETDPGTGRPGIFQVNVTVGGIVRGLPSLAYGGFSIPRAIYGSFDTFGELLDAQGLPRGYSSVSPTFFVDLEPGAPAKDMGAAIRGLGGVFVRVYEEERERQAVNPFQQGLLAFIGMEVAFVAVILTAGLGLIMYAATLERNVEFAAIAARGASGWQTAAILLGEAVSTVLIGLAIGVGIGLAAAYLTLQVFLAGPPGVGVQEQFVPTLFVLPPEGLLLLLAAPAAMFATVLLIAWRIARMNVARVLKERAG